MSTQIVYPQSNPELKCLYEIARLPHPNHLQDYFLGVMKIMSQYFPIEYSALILHDSQKNFFSVEALYGIGREDHPSGCHQRTGVISKVLASRLPMVIQDLGHEPLYHEIGKGTKRVEKIHPPMLCVPIIADRVPIGVLTTSSLYGAREDLAEDLQFLSMLAIILSPVIKDLQGRKNEPLAKSDNPKLKFLVLEESLEAKLTEVLDKLAPYADSKTQTGILDDIVSVVEKILIRSALERMEHVQVAAAQLLGINRNTLHKKMKDLKIKPR
jgi:transcriptional regulator with GAF, ATPase, and Fis domain